jgi:GH18 family chitinase
MFIMSYQLNLQGAPGPVSPLTNTMYTDLETVQQYTAVAPVSKLILGAPYYGYDWPTNNGTLTAGAEGQAVPVTYAQIQSWNVPTYWDPVTDTAWTSYQVGNQWHETFFEDPTSLYMLAELAQTYDFAGVGIWALGMDNNDPAMLAALSGFAPAVKDTNPGPNSTSPSSTSPPPSSTTTTAPTTTTTTAPPITTSTVPPTSTTTTTRPTGTTTTTGPPPTTTTTGPPVHHYAGGP